MTNRKTLRFDIPADADMLGILQNQAPLVWAPDDRSSLVCASATRSCLLVNILHNVQNELYTYRYSGGSWTRQKVNAPAYGAIYMGDTDEKSDLYFFAFTNFLTLSTLYQGDAAQNTIAPHTSLQAYFDAGGLEVKQFESRSKDGIPAHPPTNRPRNSAPCSIPTCG